MDRIGRQVTTITLYGVEMGFVDSSSDHNPIGDLCVSVDADGYALADAPLYYQIKPVEYQASSCYVAIYRDNQPISYIQSETQGIGYVTISRGFKFDLNASYTAKVILNHGAGAPLEMESKEIVLKLPNEKIDRITIEDIDKNVPIMPGKQAKAIALTTPPDSEVVWNKIKDEPIDKDKPIQANIDPSSGTIMVGENSGSGWITIQASLKDAPCVYKQAKVYVGCPNCAKGEGQTCSQTQLEGGGFVELSSVNVRWSLGKGKNGAPAGDIFLQSKEPSPDLSKPKSLEFSSLLGGVDARIDKNGLRQILAPKTFVDIRTISDYVYEIDFYRPDAVTGEDAATGLYTVNASSSPFTSWRIENPDASPAIFNRLKITQSIGGSEKIYEYIWDESQQQWSLVKGNGLRIETRKKEQAGGQIIYTDTVKDAQGRVAEKKKTVFQVFSWGNGLVEAVDDPDGAALATTFTYTSDGKTESELYPDGSWVRYQYDAQGNRVAEIRPWLDAPVNTPEGSAHATYYSYTPG